MTPHRSLDVACGCGVLATPQWSGNNPKQKDHSQFLMHFATAHQCTALWWHCTRSATNLCALVGRFPCILSYTLRVEASQPIVEIVIQWLPETLRTCTNSPVCGSIANFCASDGGWSPPIAGYFCHNMFCTSCNNKIIQPFIRQQDSLVMLHQDDATAGSEHLIDELIHKLLPIVTVGDTWQAHYEKDPLFSASATSWAVFLTRGKAKWNLNQWSTRCRIHLYSWYGKCLMSMRSF